METQRCLFNQTMCIDLRFPGDDVSNFNILHLSVIRKKIYGKLLCVGNIMEASALPDIRIAKTFQIAGKNN